MPTYCKIICPKTNLVTCDNTLPRVGVYSLLRRVLTPTSSIHYWLILGDIVSKYFPLMMSNAMSYLMMAKLCVKTHLQVWQFQKSPLKVNLGPSVPAPGSRFKTSNIYENANTFVFYLPCMFFVWCCPH